MMGGSLILAGNSPALYSLTATGFDYCDGRFVDPAPEIAVSFIRKSFIHRHHFLIMRRLVR
jgi:hypothetical protein